MTKWENGMKFIDSESEYKLRVFFKKLDEYWKERICQMWKTYFSSYIHSWTWSCLKDLYWFRLNSGYGCISQNCWIVHLYGYITRNTICNVKSDTFLAYYGELLFFQKKVPPKLCNCLCPFSILIPTLLYIHSCLHLLLPSQMSRNKTKKIRPYVKKKC